MDLKTIKKQLRELGFHKNDIKVYLAMTTLGESIASNVAKKANLPRTTTIGILDKLERKGFLSSHIYKRKNYYWVESPKNLEEYYLNRVRIAKNLEGVLEEMYRKEADFPYAEIHDSAKGIQRYIEKVLISLPQNAIILTIDTPAMGNYRKIFSDDFGNSLLALKNKKGIVTNTLIPSGSFKTIDPVKLNIQQINIRELPEKINFTASLWIIEDTVVLFSGKYPFVVSVNHAIIKESIKSIFDFLWELAEPMR